LSFQNYAAQAGFACLVITLTGQASAQAPAQPILTLKSAFELALADAPAMKAADQGRKGAEASVRQADRMPNPSLDITAENLGGGSLYQGFDRLETTLAFSQKLEWGDDRLARTGLATADVSLAKAGGEIRRQALLAEVETAYLGVQRASADLQIALERVQVAREIASTVDKRVQAARDPLMAGSRAQASLADAEIDAEAARRAEVAAKARLSSFWGGATDFSVDVASFGMMALAGGSGASGNAELALAVASETRANAAIAVERARAQQDPTISAGLRYFNQTDETALVVGFAIPLPFWDKNDGAIAHAEAERSRLKFESEAVRRNVEREIGAAGSQMEIARAEIEAVDQRLLPSAEQALAQARQGYASGGFSYLDVLEAQRIVVDARLRRVSALFSYHTARVSMARLTGAYAGQIQ
jgi:cobalt-zinc-cadmium efflux system outer membrane protein